MSRDRMIHPGPRAACRVEAEAASLRRIAGRLPAGQTVLEAVGALFAQAGCAGGMIALDGAVCEPLDYVLPALSQDGLHAAWYSDRLSPRGRHRILRATASVGRKDGRPFLHCHGLWSGPDGIARMGHLLPAESVLAEDARVTAIASADAWFEALPDAETAFTLFQPRGTAGAAGPGLLGRLAPGEDVATALESLCAARGIRAARVHGLGSIDHIRFRDGSRVDCLATELRLAGARLRDGRATLPIEVVDIDARIHTGVLAAGENPVGVTLEFLIEPSEER